MPLNVIVYRVENLDNIIVAFIMLDSKNKSLLAEESNYVTMVCKIDWLRIVEEAKEITDGT